MSDFVVAVCGLGIICISLLDFICIKQKTPQSTWGLRFNESIRLNCTVFNGLTLYLTQIATLKKNMI